MYRSALPESRTCWSIVRRADAPTVETTATRARPTIRVEAAPAVRDGWRRAFPTPSRAVMLKRPITPRSPPASGMTIHRDSIDSPKNPTTIPRPIRAAASAVISLVRLAVQAASPNPPRARATGTGARVRRSAPALVSDSASSGVTRPARNAGHSPPSVVTSTPTATATMTMAGVMRKSTSSPPISIALAPAHANRTPSAPPTTAAARPMMTDSPSTIRTRVDRFAPTARSRPSSRVRCATITLRTLITTRIDTSRVTPA